MLKKISAIRTEISMLEAEILAIQTLCPHPKEHLEKRHEADTGNYDRTQDGYWTHFHCKNCDKRWTKEGSL
jgi:hypothetical protein